MYPITATPGVGVINTGVRTPSQGDMESSNRLA
nr:MAG TPA: hypothetical protein [Caudoviricetes sp.]